ncbi:hypothetical protein DY000_02009163 [Brassica cretica]|uniref:Uncharacterized protein n=1 Tax=Brassica cretica TaxID=69181 RepID=A0ABQ7C640_BRACR|nr:hypothetical protein DY000_02009163 [Brassica cretica]
MRLGFHHPFAVVDFASRISMRSFFLFPSSPSMAPLVAGPASVPCPPSDPPVPPDPPPDTLFTGFLWLYDLWATITFRHKFLDPKLVCSCPFTAVCRCCPFTAVCRLPSTFALMAFVMISNCPPFSFKECFVLPHLSLVISEIVIGSIVLKMVLFEAEAKMFIVSHLDGVNCLISLAMEVFIPLLYCFEQERQFEEVFLIDCPLSETTVVELVISPLSLSFYLSTCCLSFLICLSMVSCSHIVSFIDGVELF